METVFELQRDLRLYFSVWKECAHHVHILRTKSELTYIKKKKKCEREQNSCFQET